MHSDASDDKQAAPPVGATMPATVPECHAVIEALVLEVGHLREQMSWLQERLKVDSRAIERNPAASIGTRRPLPG